MILQYGDFFKSFKNFITLRPDLMLEIIKHNFLDYKVRKKIKLEISESFFILKDKDKKYVDIGGFLRFSNRHKVQVYYIYNQVTYEYQLFASIPELDINSGHYTDEDNIIRVVTNKELSNFLISRKWISETN